MGGNQVRMESRETQQELKSSLVTFNVYRTPSMNTSNLYHLCEIPRLNFFVINWQAGFKCICISAGQKQHLTESPQHRAAPWLDDKNWSTLHCPFCIDDKTNPSSFFPIKVWHSQKESKNTYKHKITQLALKSATCLVVPPGLPHQYSAPLPLRFPLWPTLIQSPSLQTRTKPPIVQPQTLNRHLIANNRIYAAEANLRRCDCVEG